MPDPTPPPFTIDVLNDLESVSDLKSLLSSNQKVLFQIGGEIVRFFGKPVSNAAGNFSLAVDATAAPSWTAGPVTFSLNAGAKCTITIATQGKELDAVLDISDQDKITNVQLPGTPGMTYINIDLDFTLGGSASGTGTTGEGITISGTAATAAETTFSFCQPVPSGTMTEDALKLAFSGIVFPTSPKDSLIRMAVGSSSRMTFNGSLNWELDVSYGLADYNISATSFGLLNTSATVAGQTLTYPTAEVVAAATASVKYMHSDHFGLIICKPSAASADVYLVRASASETDVSAGISVAVAIAKPTVSVDPTGIKNVVQDITKSPTLASTVANAVASKQQDYENNLLGKFSSKLTALGGDAGISVGLSNTNSRVILFNYQVDLTQPAITQTWNDLLSSSIKDARHLGGFTLMPGSGVAKQLSKSATLQFHFFNLFSYSNTNTFYDNCTAALMADGTIRITADVGQNSLTIQNASQAGVNIHFLAVASEGTTGNLSNQSVDLVIEFKETGNAGAVDTMAGVLSLLKQPTLLNPAITAMRNYRSAYPAGPISLIATLKSSAYGKLSFSPFSKGLNSGNPPSDQDADKDNWQAIYVSAVTLLGSQDQVVTPWTYDLWSQFNGFSNAAGDDDPPNRRAPGNTNRVPAWFYKNNLPGQDVYFLTATAQGMNFFEDLVTLAKDKDKATTPDQWGTIQKDLALIVQHDLNQGYGQVIASAVLTQAMQTTATLNVHIVQASDNSSFTMNLVIS